MSQTTGVGLRIVTAHTSGWCDPATGVCHLDVDEGTSVVAGVAPDADVTADASGR